MANLEVANTILQQLGGMGRLRAMIGAGFFAGDSTGLQFSFKGSRKVRANKCRIELTPWDLYKMSFYKLNPKDGTLVTVAEVDYLYADQLMKAFYDITGLFLNI